MYRHCGKLAIAAMAVILTIAGAANATTFTFNWSDSDPAAGFTAGIAAGLTADIATSNFITPNLTLNGALSTPVNFITVAPNPSSDGGGGCPQCKNGYIDIGTVNVTFSNIHFGSTYISGTFSDSAIFTAKYGGAELACAVGDGKSPATGDTDCLKWTSPIIQIALTGALSGDFLDIFLNDATDWNLTPTIQFALTSHGQVTTPLPATLPLFATGLGALGLLGWRRKRKAAALAAT